MRRPLILAVASLGVARIASAQFKVAKEDVSFMSGSLRMAGTLYLPKVQGKAPAVVLIHGSGRVDRASMEYFAKIFAENGVAALAYDKRGVGKSQGPEFAWRDYNFDDLAGDAAAGVAFLAANAAIDAEKIGLFGASQGGWVVPIAATRAPNVRFMILASASVSTVATDNVFERSARLTHEGFTAAEVAEARGMHLVDLDVSRTGMRLDEFTRLWNDNKTKRWFPRVYLDTAPSAPESRYRKWYRTVMDVDPVPVLRELTIPALWLFGDSGLDAMSPVRTSIQALETLRASGKPYEIHAFPGADHSLQMKGTDAVFRPALVEWLRKTLK